MLTRLIAAFGVLLIFLGVAEWLARSHHDRLERQQHEDVLLRSAEMRARLESALNASVFLAQGLVAYVVGVETPAEPQVSRALQAVHDADPKIRNIGLAPDNRIAFVYPLRSNEAALGLRYQDVPAQWPSVKKAIDSGQSVLAGPVRLVQGGTGIINRTPVFRADGSYWGLVSTVIDLDALVRQVGLAAEVDGVRYWLHGDNGAPELDAAILGNHGAVDARALRLPISVPGGRWELRAAPAAGWDAHHRELLLLRAALYMLSFAFAAAVLALLNSRADARRLAHQLGQLNHQLVSSNQELHSLSQHDPLTKLPNRRSFDAALQHAWRSCSQEQKPLSILMIDIDHFKTINDSHGHAAGDTALVEVAAAIQSQVRRADDVLARYGGEEFIVLSTGLSEVETTALAQRIRQAVGSYRVQLDSSQPHSLTVSIGTATTVPVAERSPQALIDAADRALYAAKNGGRNRVVTSAAIPAPR